MIFPQNEVFFHCQVSLLELDGLILEVTYSILRILKMDDPFTEPFCDPMAPSKKTGRSRGRNFRPDRVPWNPPKFWIEFW